MDHASASTDQCTYDQFPPTQSQPVVGSIDWFLGLGLGLPAAVPGAPWYWIAFAAMLVAIIRWRFDDRLALIRLGLCVACMVIAILANIFSPYADMLRVSTVLPSILFFSFFLFGNGVRDRLSLLHGFTLSVTIYAGIVVAAFFYLEIYSNGLQLYVLPAKRLWGYSLFYDWPNMLSIIFGLGCLVNYLIFRRKWWGALTLFAAIVTTSRSVAIAIALLMVFAAYKALSSGRFMYQFLVLVAIVGIIAMLGWAGDNLTDAAAVINRISKTGDREIVYQLALDLMAQNPLLGIGSVQYGAISNYVESFHNSYLKVGTRFGIFGLFLFIFLIIPLRVRKDLKFEYILLIVYLPILGLVQDALQHPHLALLQSVFIVSAANGFVDRFSDRPFSLQKA